MGANSAFSSVSFQDILGFLYFFYQVPDLTLRKMVAVDSLRNNLIDGKIDEAVLGGQYLQDLGRK